MDRTDAPELLQSADTHLAIPHNVYKPQVLKRPLEEADDEQDVKRPRAAETVRRHPKYKRHGKPPYTYVGMMVVAIHTSSTKRLTLVGIRDTLATMFPFFQGEYLGWRDSIRHNLSSNQCFTRIQRGVNKNIKGCFWAVDLSLVPPTAFLRATIKDPVQRKQWAPTLTQQLGIPDIDLTAELAEIKTEKHEVIQHETSEERRSVTHTTTFSIESILSKDTKPDLISEPPDKKFDHPYSFLGHQTSITYLQGKFPRPASTFSPYAAVLYQTVNSDQVSDAASFLRPDPQYSECHAFSTLTAASDFRKFPDTTGRGQASSSHPEQRSYTTTEPDHVKPSEHDLDQLQMTTPQHYHKPSPMSYHALPTNYNQTSSSMNFNQSLPSMSYHPQPTSYHPQSTSYHPQSTSYHPESSCYNPESTSYHPQPTSYHPSPSPGHKPSSQSTDYLPPPASYQQAFSSMDHNQGPFSYHRNQPTSYHEKPPLVSFDLPSSMRHHQAPSSTSHQAPSSSLSYNRWDTEYPDPPSPARGSSDSQCNFTNLRPNMYIPAHISDSSDSYPTAPPRSSALPPIPTSTWATYLCNTNNNYTSSPHSLKTAFDDIAMFSDTSSEVSVRPNIPLYAIVDDTQSLSDSIVPESVASEQTNPAFSPCNPEVVNHFQHFLSGHPLNHDRTDV
ncbi:forkhead box protein H1-like [Haliotis cracherodii]|uniref:forkhead box protein H1-like n=1 Tax=Haliotis cracherodii TaxID=6455 RepID=UPI0039EBEC7E